MRRRLGLLALLLIWGAAGRATLTPVDDRPLGDRLPVVLIHGWNADPRTFDPFVAQARTHPRVTARCKLYRFAYDWSQAVTSSAGVLRDDLAARPELAGRPVALVGHSMGGLVARTYAETTLPGWDGPDRVGWIITLGTPHHGSPAANVEWLTGSSRYSLLTDIVPTGVGDLLFRVPILRAVRTEGGRDLGWDNYDSAMPAELWPLASRFLRLLNSHLLLHPLRDELLLRYSLHASYLESVPALNALALGRAINAGDQYAAGAALVAHAFRSDGGRRPEGWQLNDGIVPLESACFLQPGPAVATRRDGRLVLDRQVLEARLLRPGMLAGLYPGLNHSEIAADAEPVGAVLDALATLDFNGLVITAADGRLALWRPGAAAAVPLAGAPAAGVPLAAPTAGSLLVARDDALWLTTPESAQVVARAAAAGEWLPSPGGLRAVAPDGALVGATVPAYARLAPGAVTPALWSPDGARLAYTAPGGLAVQDMATLTARIPPAPVGPGLRPLAWTPSGRYLVASASPSLTAAAFSPDGQQAALVVAGGAAPGGSVEALVFDAEAAQRNVWAIPAPAAGPALVLKQSGEERYETLAAPAQAPVWSPDGRWLAWIDGAEGASLGLRLGGRNLAVPVPQGRLTALAASGPDAVVAAAATADGAALQRYDIVSGQWRTLSVAPAAPAGPLRVSPDARHTAVALADGRVLVASSDGVVNALVRGEQPLWLPLPAHRRWTGASAPRT